MKLYLANWPTEESFYFLIVCGNKEEITIASNKGDTVEYIPNELKSRSGIIITTDYL